MNFPPRHIVLTAFMAFGSMDDPDTQRGGGRQPCRQPASLGSIFRLMIPQ